MQLQALQGAGSFPRRVRIHGGHGESDPKGVPRRTKLDSIGLEQRGERDVEAPMDLHKADANSGRAIAVLLHSA